MRFTRAILTGVGAISLMTSVAGAAERPKVEVECKPAGEQLVYMCMFSVTERKSGAPIENAEFKVNVDMPAMPMAHNIRPVTPSAAGEPGMYHGKLQLEMMGEWALKMEFKKPVRDVVIKKLLFGDMATHEGHKSFDPSSHGKAKRGDHGGKKE